MNDHAAQIALQLTEKGLLPDAVVRAGIRRLCKARLQQIDAGDCERAAVHLSRFVEQMNQSEIALLPAKANAQHYEVPEQFFGMVLGPRRKYSACWWGDGVNNLEKAENEALRLTCEHADLQDGQRILELGCGWGAVTLWMAQHYPNSTVLGVSNSQSQRAYISQAARERGLHNVRIVTCDMNEFSAEGKFDRVVSVEMFEHMRNWRLLFERISGWLTPDGRFFMHVFCHRDVPYTFETLDSTDWMSEHFFSGGMMPSDDLALRFPERLRLAQQWRWDGTHYQKTANAWLANLDAHRALVPSLLASAHGDLAAHAWTQRWRIFFMSCAELFGYDHGKEWWVSHYLFDQQASRNAGKNR